MSRRLDLEIRCRLKWYQLESKCRDHQTRKVCRHLLCNNLNRICQCQTLLKICLKSMHDSICDHWTNRKLHSYRIVDCLSKLRFRSLYNLLDATSLIRASCILSLVCKCESFEEFDSRNGKYRSLKSFLRPFF